MKHLIVLVTIVSISLAFFACKPKPREIPPMPNLDAIKATISVALDRSEREKDPQGVRDQKIEIASQQLTNCLQALTGGGCDKRNISRYHLMLGDLTFDAEEFQKATDHYQNSVISRFEAFEMKKTTYAQHEKINLDERKKLGDKPNLIAGGAFVRAEYSMTAYQDYVEIVRTERRMAQTLKKSGKEAMAADALARGELGLSKAMEFRKTYEESKRELLGVMDQLSAEYVGYQDHIDSWDAQLNVPRI
jgi:hypothetical protein